MDKVYKFSPQAAYSVVIIIISMLFVCLEGSFNKPAQGEVYSGIYGVGVGGNFKEIIAIVENAGFQLAVIGADRAQLDAVEKAGMKGIVAFWLKAEVAADDDRWKSFLADLRLKITALKSHPALFAWYLVDEPDGQKVPIEKLKEMRLLVKNIDPVTPLFSVFDNPRKWSEYFPYFDIVGVDPYLRKKMIGGFEEPSVVREWLQRAKNDMKKLEIQRPLWVVLGAFDAVPRETGRTHRYRKPTPDEFRDMVTMSLEEGVHGILVYTFAFKDSPQYLDWNLPQSDPLLWEAVQQIFGRMKFHRKTEVRDKK